MKTIGWMVLACGFGMLGVVPVKGFASQAALSKAPAAKASVTKAKRMICMDKVFYGQMPGKTDYCLGLRAWQSGHYDTGLELLKLAAGWGSKGAQYTLGLIYYNGHHVPVNRALGLAWLELANQRRNDPQIERVAYSTRQWATSNQRKQAQALYLQMRKAYGDKVAATRAWRHLRHWRLAHTPFYTKGCVIVYGQEAYVALSRGIGNPVRPNRKGLAGFAVCVRLNTRHVLVQKLVQKYFHGFMGTVTVGPLQQVKASAASTVH
ncbi:MAG TPA: hypothetical protein VF269_00855 [Rhodanobacteraceae bacterium]